ncbi:MAG: hypothetical protein WCE54_13110 [Ignavibacteriaceae bacterium]
MLKQILSIIVFSTIIFLPYNMFGQSNLSQDQQSGKAETEHEDLFVHPFFAHMALADEPGTVSFRLSGLQFREGTDLSNDFAYHIEAGLAPNLGIHLRSDGVNHEAYSEMMLMYNVFTTENENFGISVFGQVSIPTGSVESNTYKGLFGFGIKEALPPVVVFNGDIHYDAKDKMAEYEGAFVFRASKLFYPIIEGGGEITQDGTSFYLLPGIKFRIQENQTIGLGFKGAITTDREYDVLSVLQYGIEF